MVANAPFGSSTSLLEELKGQEIGMQQLNSKFSSLFSSTMSNSNVGIQNADNSMSANIPYFAPQHGESPYHPISPMSPAFRQQDAPSLAWHSLSSDSSSSQGRNNIPSSPVIYSRTSFTQVNNTPVSSGVRSSQFSERNNQLDPFGSFLPPPPNLERSDSSQHMGRLDQIGVFPSLNHIQPASPFLSSPKRIGLMNDPASNIVEAAFSSPGNYLRQSSHGPKSSPMAPSSQILYEDTPSTWNGGNEFSVQSAYREGTVTSPSTYDRFNSRPPRHCGTKETQALLSPRVNLRHAASDGNFNIPFTMPLATHASPIPDTNNERHQHVSLTGFGASSFDSSVQSGGQLNVRHTFGSTDTLNTNVHFQQYQISQSSPIPLDPNSSSMRQDNHFVHRSPATPILNRHNSTGTQHYLVNERGEIVGRASPMISHSLPEGFSPIEQITNVPHNRQHRSASHGGHFAGQLTNTLPQHSTSLNLNFNPITFHSDATNEAINSSLSMGNHVGAIGEGRMQHQRHKTEPIPFPLFHQSNVGIVEQRNRATTDSYEQDPTGVKIEVTEDATQDVIIIPSFGLGASGEKASGSSYAAKLMAPRPQPTMDQLKGRLSSQPLTADNSASKSGPRAIYNVKFKRSQRNFILGPRITREVKIGCYVKVEADRGEDLGIVMGTVPVEKFVVSSKRNRSMTEDSIASSFGDAIAPVHNAISVGDMKRIMRLATNDEISLLEVKREEELELLKICSTKVRQRGLPMSVVDAEYQFDRNKLTFFFQAEGRIDFRELVRDLFSMYKTRIWMEQIDKNGSVDEPTD